MKPFEFYKELYHKENERRQEVLNSLNIPIAVITAIASATYYFITTFDYETEPFLRAIFIGLISLSILSLLFAIYFLIRAFSDFTKGYEYSGIPYVKELFDWNKDLEDYYASIGQNIKEAKKHFENFLIENMVKHIDHNMYVNDKKHGFIYKSKKFLVLSIVFSLLILIPFGYNYFQKKDKVHKVELVEAKTIDDSENLIIVSKLDTIIHQINLNHCNYERQGQSTEEADSSSATSTER